MYNEGLCKFSGKKIIFEVPVIFQKWKLCCACAMHPRCQTGWFLDLNSQKYNWSWAKLKFQNSKKSCKSLHPNVQYVHKGTYFYLLLQLYEKKDSPDKWALVRAMAVDPHSFFADPDPAVFMNADPDPGGKMNADPCRSGSGSSLSNFVKNKLMKSFL